MSKGLIKVITSKKEYDDLVSSSNNRLIVIDFYAEWCGPCRQVAPSYKRLTTEYQTVSFGTVDVDEHEEIAEGEGVTAMPFFKFYKGGKMIDHVTGTNQEELRQKIETYQ